MADSTRNDDEAAALREMAANRGCRLVRSRRRKPGGDFGRYGLADAKSGKEVFGFGKAGLEASAEEIADFLRERTVSTWESSIGAVGRKPAAEPRRRTPRRGVRDVGPDPGKPAPRPKAAPPSPPPLRVRVADAVDGEAIASLLAELGYRAEADELADRIGSLSRMGEPVLVARLGDMIAGCLTWHVVPVLHRPRPVGRITLLVVAGKARRKGIGRALVEAAEAKLRQRGCGFIEVTSNVRRRGAHAFYRRLGFERTSHRFAKPLSPDGR